MYQKIPNTSIGLKKREKRIYSNPNMTFKNLNGSENFYGVSNAGAQVIDVEGTIVHEKIK